MLNDCSTYYEVKSAVNIFSSFFRVKAESQTTTRRETSFKVFTGLDFAAVWESHNKKSIEMINLWIFFIRIRVIAVSFFFDFCYIAQFRHQS